MKKLAFLLLLFLTGAFFLQAQRKIIQFNAKETNDILRNPYSGMVNYGIEVSYGEREITEYIYPGSIVYLRPAWSDLEPEEGVLNLTRFEKIRDEHLSGGCIQWAMRLVTVQKVGTDKDAFPAWLKGKVRGCQMSKGYFEPYYGDSVYVSHLESFVNRMAEKYDGDPRLAFIDISGLGLYSEWGDPESNQPGWDNDSIMKRDSRRLIDIYLRAFKKTPLSISTHIIGPDLEDRYEVMYALSKGVWLRRDGVGSPFFHKGHKELVRKYWEDRPIITEMYAIYSNYNDIKTGRNKNWSGWSFKDVVDQILDQHGMCAEMSRDLDISDAFLKNKSFDRLAREVGYRLVLSKAEFPQKILKGEKLIVRQLWKNQGVSKLYRKYPLRFYLTDSAGQEVWSYIDNDFDPTDWKRGSVYEYHSILPIKGNISFGTYDLKVALVDEVGNPIIYLGQEGRDKSGRYMLGKIKLEKDSYNNFTEAFENINLARLPDAHAYVETQNEDRPLWYVSPINDGLMRVSVSDAPGKIGPERQSFGIIWKQDKIFNTLKYYAGTVEIGKGGWFERDFWVEIYDGAKWTRLPLMACKPVYPLDSSAGNQIFTVMFNTVKAKGVRIGGYVGRRYSRYASVCEIEVYKK